MIRANKLVEMTSMDKPKAAVNAHVEELNTNGTSATKEPGSGEL